MQLVENCSVGALSPLLHVEPEQERALAAAQAVIARLRRRDLYKFCSEALVPQVGPVALGCVQIGIRNGFCWARAFCELFCS